MCAHTDKHTERGTTWGVTNLGKARQGEISIGWSNPRRLLGGGEKRKEVSRRLGTRTQREGHVRAQRQMVGVKERRGQHRMQAQAHHTYM